MKLKLMTGIFVLMAATYAVAGNCQFDSMAGTFTGQTETVNGKLYKIMKCPNGHRWYESF
ncbi:hypothetical protein N9W12_08200 [Luminiphilus sp.]|jgi:hypothetical protein|nr:hypothetical protein [Luminiphilus sp.]